MANPQQLMEGDLLIFQVECGYGVLHILNIEETTDSPVWHVAAFREMFQDIEMIEAAIGQPDGLSIEIAHIALTDRAFESTQVSKIGNLPLTENDLKPYHSWRTNSGKEVSDRSIRLELGLR